MSNKSHPPPSSSRPTKQPHNGKNPHPDAGAEGAIGTFTIRVINTITYKQTKLIVTKDYTIADVHHAYAPFEAHPEFYLWKDMYGRTLDPKKNLVQNGLVSKDEVVEFDGIGKEPCVLMVFKDGFEDDAPISLNPAHHRRTDKNGSMCRNY